MGKQSYRVSYGGKTRSVRAYSPKQAKLMGYMGYIKGKGYSFDEIQKQRKAYMARAKIA